MPLLSLFIAPALAADPLDRDALAEQIFAPFSLGDPVGDPIDGPAGNTVYSLLNSGGAEAGYVFQTEPLAPLPGFSGSPVNTMVVMDPDGTFLDVRLLDHNEPIFVSGLGEAPFHQFFEQYPGLSVSDAIVVGTPYGDGAGGSSLVYLDGVTKATASVRIAHESVMGAALAVARDKLKGISTQPPAYPDPDHVEDLTWSDLVEQGIASHHVVTNAQVNDAFAGTLWEDDDPEASDDPDAPYLDLWIVDLGPKSIARAALSRDGYDELQSFLSISTSDEPILVIETARHGLVSPDFVRNTAPDWLSAEQGGLPIGLRDADLFVDLAADAPDGVAMILRTDRRLGFDPGSPWDLQVAAIREHGMFQPQIGSVTLTASHATPDRFFLRPEIPKPTPPWLDALRNRQADLIVLGVFLTGLTLLMLLGLDRMADAKGFRALRLGILAFVIGFVGWWGQGQLSIVTVLGALRTGIDGGSFAFLLYDPFSLAVWAFAILGFVLWGRGYFCGWLCPFGAMQEFTHHLGRWLRLPRIEPSERWDARLKGLKYVLLAGLVGVTIFAPAEIDKAAEVEPFKTAITTFFIRDWYYVAYALVLLLGSAVLFKGFCRYLCPLGAVMAIGGLLRGRDWIARRAECGSPCQLCKVKCNYGAIRKSGQIQYDECFQCLDCVTIHNDQAQCVPLILAARKRGLRMEAAE
ncbi:MAG: 4Fe-4S binding protein [Marinibacterium sp.]|nr:4Fe-4S binding protein [Marinibacterium sp.]